MWTTGLRRRNNAEEGRHLDRWSRCLGFLRGRAGLSLLPPMLVIQLTCGSGGSSPVPPPPPPPEMTDQAFIEALEERTFHYFWDLADPATGLVPDRYPAPSSSSVAAVGFGLTAYPIGVERGYVARADAAARALRTLRFLEQAPQSADPKEATGYKGFFYHFLDMKTGKRIPQVELSTIDTTLLMAGALTCQSYFVGADPQETEIRQIVERLYQRVDWAWAMVRPNRICMGWTPENGFLPYDWQGYNEAMILEVLALGSTTNPVPAELWPEYTRSYAWATFQGQAHVNFGPLFGHQFSHVWLDLRGVRDAYMAAKGIDYFENSRRATYAQQAYAVQNPGQWKGYGATLWGFSACDGPIAATLNVDGRSRSFQGYSARGVSAEAINDDGTLTPSGPGGSIAFAPELAIPALQEMRKRFHPYLFGSYGFTDSFNETFPAGAPVSQGRTVNGLGWVDTDYLGIDQGVILAMVENHRSGLVWNLLRGNPHVVRGLQRAGFTGGWIPAARAGSAGRRTP